MGPMGKPKHPSLSNSKSFTLNSEAKKPSNPPKHEGPAMLRTTNEPSSRKVLGFIYGGY